MEQIVGRRRRGEREKSTNYMEKHRFELRCAQIVITRKLRSVVHIHIQNNHIHVHVPLFLWRCLRGKRWLPWFKFTEKVGRGQYLFIIIINYNKK